MRLRPAITISEQSSEVFTVRWSPDARYLAAGCGDGAVRVFNGENGRLAYKCVGGGGGGRARLDRASPDASVRPNLSCRARSLMPGTESALPATCIRFRPTGDGRTKNVLIVANAGGHGPALAHDVW